MSSRKRLSFRMRYWFYEAVMDVSTYFKGPVWLWAACRQDALQKREHDSGRPWAMFDDENRRPRRRVRSVLFDVVLAVLWTWVTFEMAFLIHDRAVVVIPCAVVAVALVLQVFYDWIGIVLWSYEMWWQRWERRHRAST